MDEQEEGNNPGVAVAAGVGAKEGETKSSIVRIGVVIGEVEGESGGLVVARLRTGGSRHHRRGRFQGVEGGRRWSF